MRKTNAGIIAVAAAAWAMGAAAGAAELAAEDVTITLAPPRARVEGTYTFVNAGDEAGTVRVTYPIPRGPGLGQAENVSVRDAAGNAVPFSRKLDGVAFEVAVPPGGEAAVSVAYEQPCEGCEYEYVIAGDRGWRPIGTATYAVVAPVQLAPLECPYELQETPAAEGLVRYEFRRDDFYPDVDFVLHWERPDFYFGSQALEAAGAGP